MLDLAGAEAAGALSNLLLADGDKVDLEVVELYIVKLEKTILLNCERVNLRPWT